MKGKKFWIIEILLIIIAFITFFVGLSDTWNCKGQVDFRKRGNIINILNPINCLSTTSILEDSEGNIYIGNLGGDSHLIQKFRSDGKYICSFKAPDIYDMLYWLVEEDVLCIYSGGKQYCYKDDKLISQEEFPKWKQEELDDIKQKNEGSIKFWAVKTDSNKTINLEKIMSLNMDYSSIFTLVIILAIVNAIFSDEWDKLEESIYGKENTRYL